ncbi:THUMP domain-containing protein 1-like [Acanthaster planci]|uniref:THUMP domain-containing protein 1-like n=1 Tax=Acanthaster planci TaxID=133434 RepID=A0A8B7YE09_ACAPL|nr:THUMP domain-containing protein 1-like [Acanthaster planci]XP_022091489.1 THUMP domain-containing protein 1-like [Acanthaster planci]
MADKRRGKKRSKAFYIQSSLPSGKKMRRDRFLDVGMRGFLLTCNRMELLCLREAYSLLSEYADKLYGPEKMGGDNDASSGSESESEPEDIEASLRREVAEMKQKREQKEMRFEAINSGAKNVIFIRTQLVDPTELVHHIMTDIANTQTCKSCHIMRMLPVSVTCRASIEDISKHAPEFLYPYFHTDGVTPATFAVRIKIRNNGTLKRDDIIKLLATEVTCKGPKHKVDLDNPDLSVVVEIIKHVCCLSVLRDFSKFKRYNLQEIVGDGDAARKASPGRSAKAAPEILETKDASTTAQDQKNNTEEITEKPTNEENLDLPQGQDNTLDNADQKEKDPERENAQQKQKCYQGISAQDSKEQLVVDPEKQVSSWSDTG